jgi:hypothetical protein
MQELIDVALAGGLPPLHEPAPSGAGRPAFPARTGSRRRGARRHQTEPLLG